MATVIPDDVLLRALSRWYLLSPTGCHVSTYSVGSHGYAQVGWYRKDGRGMVLAHRAAWIAVHGPIPGDLTVDHRCRVTKKCVNVEHMRLLDNWQNARRTSGRDWPIGQCANGHSDDEVVVLASGKRACGVCLLSWRAG